MGQDKPGHEKTGQVRVGQDGRPLHKLYKMIINMKGWKFKTRIAISMLTINPQLFLVLHYTGKIFGK